jgi:hypothetical protein
VVASYTYAYNAAHQRTSVIQDGTALTTTAPAVG